VYKIPTEGKNCLNLLYRNGRFGPSTVSITHKGLLVLQIMGDNKLIACMDSTHKTVKSLWPSEDNHKVHSDSHLFTLLVKDRKLLKGVPIAFMITNTESRYVK
jgi:hypothetical protein